jgi:hypothetical protein
VDVEALGGQGQPLAAPVERIALVATMAEGLLVDPATGAVDHPGPDPDHVEHISNGGGVEQMRGERGSERLVEVGHSDRHGLAPRLGLTDQPGLQVRGLPALDQIDHAAPGDIADGAGPAGRFPTASCEELGLIHPTAVVCPTRSGSSTSAWPQ